MNFKHRKLFVPNSDAPKDVAVFRQLAKKRQEELISSEGLDSTIMITAPMLIEERPLRKLLKDPRALKMRALKGAPVEEEVFFKDLHNTRRNIMGELESYLRHVRESGSPVETIGVYNLINQIKLHGEYLLRQLEQDSPIGGLLMDTAGGYDSLLLQQTDLGEIANGEAAAFDLLDTGDDNSDGT